MPVTALNHYFVNAKDLEATRSFYCDVLGFEALPRPDFGFPGYWLGVDGHPLVHTGLLDRFGAEPMKGPGLAPVDHVAFSATDPLAFNARLVDKGIDVTRTYVASNKFLQLVVIDPNGVTIELNFAGIAAEPDWSSSSTENPNE